MFDLLFYNFLFILNNILKPFKLKSLLIIFLNLFSFIFFIYLIFLILIEFHFFFIQVNFEFISFCKLIKLTYYLLLHIHIINYFAYLSLYLKCRSNDWLISIISLSLNFNKILLIMLYFISFLLEFQTQINLNFQSIFHSYHF